MGAVRVFVSSLMGGSFGLLREGPAGVAVDAACSAIGLLGYEAVRAEDYAASPSSASTA